MSSDTFEKNIAALVRAGALPLDARRARRARRHFLGQVRAPAGPASGRFAAVAAAVLVSVTIVWSARTEPGARPGTRAPQTAPTSSPVTLFPTGAESERLRGVLQAIPRAGLWRDLGFEGRSTLPDGVVFLVRPNRIQEQRAGDQLSATVLLGGAESCVLAGGAFRSMWPYPGPAVIQFEVTAPEAKQDREVMKLLSGPDSQRTWSFEFLAWDEGLLPRLGPGLDEVTDLAREVLRFVSRVEALTASEAVFREEQKSLIAQADGFHLRAERGAAAGLYPAAAAQVAATAQDLATALAIFRWEGGAFAGPKSYYTDGERARTFRQEPFSFAAMRRYLEEAVAIAGREFDLWILKDVRRAGLRADHREVVQSRGDRPGVAEFADQLLVPTDALESAIRKLPGR